MTLRPIALLVLAAACARRPPALTAAPALPALHGHSVPLPGSPDPVRMDYLAYDPGAHQLWIPAGNTARVDVLDTTTGALAAVEGFIAREVEGCADWRDACALDDDGERRALG